MATFYITVVILAMIIVANTNDLEVNQIVDIEIMKEVWRQVRANQYDQDAALVDIYEDGKLVSWDGKQVIL